MKHKFSIDSIHNHQFHDFFMENGFCVIEGLIDHQTIIDPILKEYTELLCSLWKTWQADGRLPKLKKEMSLKDMLVYCHNNHIDFFQYLDISLPRGDIKPDCPIHLGKSVFHLMSDPILLNVLQTFLGEEIALNPIQHVRMKPPLNELKNDEHKPYIVETHWHQDIFAASEEAYQTKMITAWVAISDCPADSGCLKVFAKSHRQGLFHHDTSSVVRIPNSELPSGDPLCLAVKSGSVIFFHPYTIHGASENKSQNLRWSFDLRYHVTGHPTGRSQFPEFILKSKQQPLCTYENWQQSWLQARENLSKSGKTWFYPWNKNQ